ncbi:YbaB/EbfC family nucleoid-associated protein [Tsukamurella sp. 8F]|uniref:YbaB/EbfC family nucleoid-associated protein n=1 Tax=unclassified Tsukamurella TaxID=2633480 RepID=UPI0023B95993|nr:MULTISPECIES: YbaB/EbfC family nucleoid-associated protein [unclassified Tsukamurella]MDF0532066.1 YbaB/EbfC family nucleoid-associated protein [Tsukamurella sp. 8J]MDF0589178.1 YbaB/EbfC family nucleoid-associated protein [Tsukamurella sp. 8F]
MQPGGSMDDLMAQVGAMQQQLMAAQAEIAAATVEGQAGGGLVRISATGDGQVQSVTIDPKVVDPDDVETLQDLVLGALNDLTERTSDLAQQKMGPLAGGMPGAPGLPGF